MTSAPEDLKLRVLFVASSPTSGSTLLPFLLNVHPQLAGVGHTTGWQYAEGEEYLCSCESSLERCPLFRAIADAQRSAGHAFDFRDFGIDYRLARNERMNSILTASLPLLRTSWLERLRDRIVSGIPAWKRALTRADQANRSFMLATLRYHGASIFVDGYQDPHRLRHLHRVPGIEISILHLVRDVRGVVFSNMTKKGWNAREATLNWIHQQVDILRIAADHPRIRTVFYEALCDEPDPTLKSIHEFVGIEPVDFGGNFKVVEHHIIGNEMRLGDGTVKKSRRWETDLTAEDRRVVEDTCRQYLRKGGDPRVSGLIAHYLGDVSQRPPAPSVRRE